MDENEAKKDVKVEIENNLINQNDMDNIVLPPEMEKEFKDGYGEEEDELFDINQ